MILTLIGCQQTPIVPSNPVTPPSTINALEIEIAGEWEATTTIYYNSTIADQPITTCVANLILTLDPYDYSMLSTANLGPAWLNMKDLFTGCSYTLTGWSRPSTTNMYHSSVNYRILQLTPTTLELASENSNFSSVYNSTVYTRVN